MHDDPGLFDLVPWNYGFVHTGVLGWLLDQPGFCRRVLDAVLPAISPGQDLKVAESPVREDRRMGAVCDLGVVLERHDGEKLNLAVETKVEDLLREEQLAGYEKAHFKAAFLPGLTGFLAAESRPLQEAGILTGKALADAFAPARDGLPPLIGSYLDALAEEADWFELRVKALRSGRTAEGDPPRTTNPKFARDIAWVVALQREIKQRDDCPISTDHMAGRVVAYDQGFFWGDAYSASSSRGGLRYYIDAAASKQRERKAIIVKAGFRDSQPEEELAAIYAHARDAGAPEGGPWSNGQRRFKRETVTCWKVDCTDKSVAETADLAIAAASWILNQRLP